MNFIVIQHTHESTVCAADLIILNDNIVAATSADGECLTLERELRADIGTT
jgi:hypothetical protein